MSTDAYIEREQSNVALNYLNRVITCHLKHSKNMLPEIH